MFARTLSLFDDPPVDLALELENVVDELRHVVLDLAVDDVHQRRQVGRQQSERQWQRDCDDILFDEHEHRRDRVAEVSPLTLKIVLGYLALQEAETGLTAGRVERFELLPPVQLVVDGDREPSLEALSQQAHFGLEKALSLCILLLEIYL